MEKKDPILMFNSEGTAVWLDFGNGSDTLATEKREEALKALKQLRLKERITEAQYQDFKKKVKEAPNLKDRKKDKGGHLTFLIIGAEFLTKDSEPVKNAHFEMCKECEEQKPHGFIYADSGWFAKPIFSAHEGFVFAKRLNDLGILDEANYQVVLADIKEKHTEIGMPIAEA